MPPEHKAQVQGCMWITEREWWDFTAYWPKLPLFTKRIIRDDTYIRTIADAVDRFNDELDATVARLRAMKQQKDSGMSASVNKVILVGNLVLIPRSSARRTADRLQTCASPRLNMARQINWRAQGKDRVAHGRHFSEPICKVAEQYLRKGSKVYLEGALQTRKWTDKDGRTAIQPRS